MLGLKEAHSWFDTRLAQKMSQEFPGIKVYYENQKFELENDQIQLMAFLSNSAADTRHLDMTGANYRFTVQYEVTFLIPEGDNIRKLEDMIGRFSVWFNKKHLMIAPAIRIDTSLTSAKNIGRTDQFYAKSARIPAHIYVEGCQHT